MGTLRFPGFIDVHVHLREPGGEHKEDWGSGTRAALAGGFTGVMAMPNTSPCIANEPAYLLSKKGAEEKCVCDYGIYAVATPANVKTVHALADRAIALKLYLDSTYGELKMEDTTVWLEHFKRWPKDRPIAVHAERRTVAAVLMVAHLADRHVHICHVALREEIEMIRAARERGVKVTCEASPHHLFLSKEDEERIGPGRCEVRPCLGTLDDQAALWENMDIIDCFATDHAPHLLSEKDGDNPPPGYTGLETAFPLLWTAVKEGRLTQDELLDRLVYNPRRIFGLSEQPNTYVEIDPDETWEIPLTGYETRANWSPFAGMKVQGRVKRVVLRGEEVFKDGEVVAAPGVGQDLRG